MSINITAEMERRIKDAAVKAECAFWEALAAEFPETSTGDFSLADSARFEQATTEAARKWVEANVPANCPAPAAS